MIYLIWGSSVSRINNNQVPERSTPANAPAEPSWGGGSRGTGAELLAIEKKRTDADLAKARRYYRETRVLGVKRRAGHTRFVEQAAWILAGHKTLY